MSALVRALPLVAALALLAPTAHMAGADGTREPVRVPTFLAPVELGTLLGGVPVGAEPGLAIAPDGTVYVTTPAVAWRSDDLGYTYHGLGASRCPNQSPIIRQQTGVCLFPQFDAGLQGPGDASMAVAANGTVWWAGLFGFTASVPVQYSNDKGDHWSAPFDAAAGTSTDREWITIDAADNIWVQWRDFTSGSHIAFRKSTDGGATWSPIREPIADGRQGPMAHDATTGYVYLPHILPGAGGMTVARSIDGGASWTDVPVAPLPERAWIFPGVAVDSAGTVYALWSADPDQLILPNEAGRHVAVPTVFLSVSTDHGITWSAPRAISAPGMDAIFPWIVAGDAGRVAIAWYEGVSPTPGSRLPNVWNVKVAMSTTADLPDAEFVTVTVNTVPIHLGGLCAEGGGCFSTAGDRTLLDFFEIRALPDGSPILAYAADGLAPQASIRVMASRMIDGTSLYEP